MDNSDRYLTLAANRSGTTLVITIALVCLTAAFAAGMLTGAVLGDIWR